MPGKRKPPPVFTRRTNDPFKVNYGITAEGAVYVIEMRGSYCGGREAPPVEKTRRFADQLSKSACRVRKLLSVDASTPKA